MSLRHILSNTPETLQEFDLAAQEKYEEGKRLVAGGDTGAGIYLLGYAAEMLLKTAYFRLKGAYPSDEVGSRLAPARTAGKSLIPGIHDESYHSLRFWAMLLQKERERQGLAALPFELDFEICTERLYNNWWVEMRYRWDRSAPADAVDVLSDVGWLFNNHASLWMP